MSKKCTKFSWFKVNMTEAGHSLSDMLLECIFQASKCTVANFTRWQHGTYGNCYTMIIPRNKYPSFIGPLYGLSLTLYAQDSEYMPTGWPTAGFRVRILYFNALEDHFFDSCSWIERSVATIVERSKLIDRL